jgi:hypothetical protein
MFDEEGPKADRLLLETSSKFYFNYVSPSPFQQFSLNFE